jgi:hypothetical protein
LGRPSRYGRSPDRAIAFDRRSPVGVGETFGQHLWLGQETGHNSEETRRDMVSAVAGSVRHAPYFFPMQYSARSVRISNWPFATAGDALARLSSSSNLL